MEKERGMMLRAMDALIQRINPADYPTAGRTFLSTMQGVRKPITESNFTPDELGVVRRLIEQKGGEQGEIVYPDYRKYSKQQWRDPNGKAPYEDVPGLASLLDPYGNVQTTLGQFRYRRDPTSGDMMVYDDYDFNQPQNPDAELQAESMALSPYALIRYYAGKTLPPGTGRSVTVRVPGVAKAPHRETARETMKRIVAEEANARAQQRRK